jgi:hypothetical protein
VGLGAGGRKLAKLITKRLDRGDVAAQPAPTALGADGGGPGLDRTEAVRYLVETF